MIVERYADSQPADHVGRPLPCRWRVPGSTRPCRGTAQHDRLGADQPVAYWYALGRDEPLERQISEDVKRDLRS